jgi:hypothetical protein
MKCIVVQCGAACNGALCTNGHECAGLLLLIPVVSYCRLEYLLRAKEHFEERIRTNRLDFIATQGII